MGDISGHAQLQATVRSVDGEAIRENLLFCKALPGKNDRRGHFRITTEYLNKGDLGGELHERLY